MRPDGAAFVVPHHRRGEIARRRVLLLDDTYVSGARAQSAAAALRLAGATAVLIVTLGRTLRPDRSALHEAFTERLRTAGAPCGRCVLQTGAPTE
jgi:hypothetical protein